MDTMPSAYCAEHPGSHLLSRIVSEICSFLLCGGGRWVGLGYQAGEQVLWSSEQELGLYHVSSPKPARPVVTEWGLV